MKPKVHLMKREAQLMKSKVQQEQIDEDNK